MVKDKRQCAFSFQVQEYSQEIVNEASNPPTQADELSAWVGSQEHASCIPGDKKTLKCGFHAIKNELSLSLSNKTIAFLDLTTYTYHV